MVGRGSVAGIAAIFKLASLLPERVISPMAVWAGPPRPRVFLVPHFKNRFSQSWRYWLLYAFPGKWQLPSREAFAENRNWRCLLAARTEIDALFVFSSGPPDDTARTA